MGDRCYMTVWCRPQDVTRFTEIGFNLQEHTAGSFSEEMVDEEANYAHHGDMPADIPYHGWHASGGDYGPMDFACTGHEFDEWEAGHGNNGYVFANEPGESNAAWIEEVARFHAFRKIRDAAHKIVDTDPSLFPPEQATLMHLGCWDLVQL